MIKNCIFFLILLSSINLVGQSSLQIENLKTFARLYGYVKYFHPSDEAALADWDKFAIYGSEKVINCKDNSELLSTLNELFLPISPTIKIYFSKDNFKLDISKITPSNYRKYKITAWQHVGLGLGMRDNGGVYRSVRINRDKMSKKLSKMSGGGSGMIMTYLDAKDLIGKTVKLTGLVKLKKGSVGTGHMFLRVDRTNLRVGFSENMDNNPITSGKWKKYQIQGKLDSLASGIALGCYLEGHGELMVGDFHLYYLHNNKWIEYKFYNNDFESDKLGTSIQRRDKTWIVSGKNYDIGRVQGKARRERFYVVIKSIDEENSSPLFRIVPKIGEVTQKEIGNGLSCIVPLALYCTELQTYPTGSHSKLDSVLELVNIDEGNLARRLGDVVIIWNVFQHFYPYLDVVNVNLENQLEKTFSKCFADKDESDFLQTLEEFTASLKDGHMSVNSNFFNVRVPGITWEFIENKLVVTKVCDDQIPLKVGDIITQVNNLDPKDYFSNLEKRISAATIGWMSCVANQNSLKGERGDKLRLKVNDTVIELTCDSRPNSCVNSIKESNIRYKWIDSNIIYLNLTLISMKTIDSLIPRLLNVNSIICDLRGYPNGNDGLISYMLKKNDHDKWMFKPQIIYPDQKNIAGYQDNGHGWNLQVKTPHISAKVVFITDPTAISYAESYLGFIEGYKLGIIVGQPTAGTNGNINNFILPGDYSVYWTGMKVLKHNGSQFHGIGITPDIFVTKTIKGVKEGRDEFLEKAIEIARYGE